MWIYENLQGWQVGHELAKRAHAVTESFPVHIRYELGSQLRRAAVSIPTNVAEGSGRATPADFARFLTIAAASASEVEYLVRLAAELGLIGETVQRELNGLAREARRSIVAYRNALLPRTR